MARLAGSCNAEREADIKKDSIALRGARHAHPGSDVVLGDRCVCGVPADLGPAVKTDLVRVDWSWPTTFRAALGSRQIGLRARRRGTRIREYRRARADPRESLHADEGLGSETGRLGRPPCGARAQRAARGRDLTCDRFWTIFLLGFSGRLLFAGFSWDHGTSLDDEIGGISGRPLLLSLSFWFRHTLRMYFFLGNACPSRWFLDWSLCLFQGFQCALYASMNNQDGIFDIQEGVLDSHVPSWQTSASFASHQCQQFYVGLKRYCPMSL